MFVPRKKHGRSAGYGTAGSAPALSRARRKTSGRKIGSKIDRPHSSSPGLELARGSIAYGPEARAGGKAGAKDCGAVDGVELSSGSSGPVSSTRTVENLVYSAASRSWRTSEKTCGVIAAEVREKRHVRSQAISYLIKVVSGAIGRDLIALDRRGDHRHSMIIGLLSRRRHVRQSCGSGCPQLPNGLLGRLFHIRAGGPLRAVSSFPASCERWARASCRTNVRGFTLSFERARRWKFPLSTGNWSVVVPTTPSSFAMASLYHGEITADSCANCCTWSGPSTRARWLRHVWIVLC